MILKRATRNRNARLDVLDTLMDSYVHWRDASRAVGVSYRNWRSARQLDCDVAFDEYVAALDREEHAACGYRYVVERTQLAHHE